MAYPRRQSRTVRTSTEEQASSPELAPPRPFFLADSSQRRSSNSSLDTNSLDPASDSDSSPEQPQQLPSKPKQAVQVRQRKRSSMSQAVYAPVHNDGESESPKNWDPTSLYQQQPAPTSPATGSRPPPSSFAFPFQAYPGNPDPGLAIPGHTRRRSSLDSTTQRPSITTQPSADESQYLSLSPSGSMTDLRKPFAPFMASGEASSSTGSLPRSSSSNSLYRQSAAGNMMPAAVDPATPTTPSHIPRVASSHSFRAPFLAPSSRPTSSFWAPPSYGNSIPLSSPTASTTALPYTISKSKPPLPSTRLAAPLEKSDKPWLAKPEKRTRISYCITLTCIFLGICGAAALIFLGWTSVKLLDESQLCQVMDEQFDQGSLDANSWTKDVEMGGFGNGEFQMTTDEDDNLFLQNNQLYIVPTLSSDKIPNIVGGKFGPIAGCTTAKTNGSACSSSGGVVPPVQSARIHTKNKVTIKFGKVEIRAKLPQGDWLWPAIWMLPEDSVYGQWPASGEIDIMEARGNGISYPSQGSNFVRASLNYGPMPALFTQIFGWWSSKRTSYGSAFHTYTLEWDEKFIRVYIDKRTQSMMEVDIGSGKKKSFWDKAGFPLTAANGTSEVVVPNPYAVDGATQAAPFDQNFYLVVNVAAGGTSGWFPDGKGNKPWIDGDLNAMKNFALAQDQWSATWPSNVDDRAFRIDYIKMWTKC